MKVREAYDEWALQYDTNINKTRDLEGQALRTCLEEIQFSSCLEIGCGTGKNTTWLLKKATSVTAVDLSAEMLAKAKEKISDKNVQFIQADIMQEWTFSNRLYDLVTFSLVLEHIECLEPIFAKTYHSLVPGGYVYIGELHPFKQYTGTKARFDTAAGQQVVTCFTHNLSDFIRAAKKQDFIIEDVNEYFDENDKTAVPRIVTILLKKP